MPVIPYTATGGENEITLGEGSEPVNIEVKIVWEEGKTIPFDVIENKVTLDHTLQEGASILILEKNL